MAWPGDGNAVGESLVAAGEGWEDGDDVAGAESVVGAAVEAVDQGDAVEVGGDAETADDIADGAVVGNLEDRRPLTTVGGQERDERREESDLDPHLNPPCPSDSTDGRTSATRRRSP